LWLSKYFDNRKNSLVGNPRGGRTAGFLASLTSICRRQDVAPQLYFTQLLMNLPPMLGELPHTRRHELDAWIPDQWKLLHAARTALLSHSAQPTICLAKVIAALTLCFAYRSRQSQFGRHTVRHRPAPLC
jgi:hypothetical protein